MWAVGVGVQAVAAEENVKSSTADLSSTDASAGQVAAAGAALMAQGLTVVWPDQVVTRLSCSDFARFIKPHREIA
jgi:hypothetical protein